MDLSSVISKIDLHKYLTVKDYLSDIDPICSNALEYNPDRDPGGEHLVGFVLFCFVFLTSRSGTRAANT